MVVVVVVVDTLFTLCSRCSQGTDWLLPQAMPDAGVLVNNARSNFTREIHKYLTKNSIYYKNSRCVSKLQCDSVYFHAIFIIVKAGGETLRLERYRKNIKYQYQSPTCLYSVVW